MTQTMIMTMPSAAAIARLKRAPIRMGMGMMPAAMAIMNIMPT